jgi:hypothetical protein
MIHVIRGQKVMVDADLAALYGVPTGALNQAVKRNRERFPEDFASQLSPAELANWMSHAVISNRLPGWGCAGPVRIHARGASYRPCLRSVACDARWSAINHMPFSGGTSGNPCFCIGERSMVRRDLASILSDMSVLSHRRLIRQALLA